MNLPSKWKWTVRKELAAQLLALGDLSSIRIAQKVGIAESTLFEWKHAPEFKQRIEENGKEVNHRLKQEAEAEFQARRKWRQELLDRVNQVVDEITFDDFFTLRTEPLKAIKLALRIQSDLDTIDVKIPRLLQGDVVVNRRESGRQREMLFDVDALTAQLMQSPRQERV